MIIECPSGLSFKCRKWRVGDRRHLQDSRIVKQGLLLRKMLECVDEGVENPGPYPLTVGKPTDWNKTALSDIITALIKARSETSSELEYTENCSTCGARIPVSIDLTLLDYVPMSAEGIEHLSSGEPVERSVITDLGEVNIKFKLLRGRDTPKLTQHYKQDPAGASEAQMVMHIAELTTPEGTVLSSFNNIREFYKMQDWGFSEQLDEAITEIGGGVVTVVDLDCNRCNAEQQGIVPFGDDFFFPRKKRPISSMGML